MDEEDSISNSILTGQLQAFPNPFYLPRLEIPLSVMRGRSRYSETKGAFLLAEDVAEKIITSFEIDKYLVAEFSPFRLEWGTKNNHSNVRIVHYSGRLEECYDRMKKISLHLNAKHPNWLPAPVIVPSVLAEHFDYLSEAIERVGVKSDYPCCHMYTNLDSNDPEVIHVCMSKRHKSFQCKKPFAVVRSDNPRDDEQGHDQLPNAEHGKPSSSSRSDEGRSLLPISWEKNLGEQYHETVDEENKNQVKRIHDVDDANIKMMEENEALKQEIKELHEQLKEEKAKVAEAKENGAKWEEKCKQVKKAKRDLFDETRKVGQQLAEIEADKKGLENKFKFLRKNTTNLFLTGSEFLNAPHISELEKVKELAKTLFEMTGKVQKSLKKDVTTVEKETIGIVETLNSFTARDAATATGEAFSLIPENQQQQTPAEDRPRCAKAVSSSLSATPINPLPTPVVGAKRKPGRPRKTVVPTNPALEEINDRKPDPPQKMAKTAKNLANSKVLKRKPGRPSKQIVEQATQKKAKTAKSPPKSAQELGRHSQKAKETQQEEGSENEEL